MTNTMRLPTIQPSNLFNNLLSCLLSYRPGYMAACLLCSSMALASATDAADQLDFDDTMLEQPLTYPEWFKTSFGDLRDDLAEANKAGKNGIALYFGQKRCAYCEQFIKQDLGEPDIARYMQLHYDVIAIDIWGIDDLIDTDDKTYTERELSLKYKANFTPTMVFYNSDGKAVFRLRGFYPPYKFRAALEYTTEKYYLKETFRDYLARAEPGMFFMEGGLTERDFFSGPPYDLDQMVKSGKPLAVFFEQGNCHACDLLHTGPLNSANTIDEINKMQSVQLDMWSDTPVTTPAGKKTTAKQWANTLGLFHAPTILFFDESGKEIMRIDSIVQYYRLWGVLDYINKRAYKTHPDYQAWRLQQRKTN